MTHNTITQTNRMQAYNDHRKDIANALVALKARLAKHALYAAVASTEDVLCCQRDLAEVASRLNDLVMLIGGKR
jgi:hypothetical protein